MADVNVVVVVGVSASREHSEGQEQNEAGGQPAVVVRLLIGVGLQERDSAARLRVMVYGTAKLGFVQRCERSLRGTGAEE
jgi:hypothetical protein